VRWKKHWDIERDSPRGEGIPSPMIHESKTPGEGVSPGREWGRGGDRAQGKHTPALVVSDFSRGEKGQDLGRKVSQGGRIGV